MAIDLGVLQSTNIDLGVLQSAGSGNLTLNISDSFTFSDGAVTTQLTPVSLTHTFSDTFSFSDPNVLTILTPVSLTQSFSDSFTFSDFFQGAVVDPSFILQISDSFEFFELLETSTITRLLLVDFFYFYKENLSEVISGAPVATSDFFSFNDKIQQRLDGFAPINDSLVFSDSIEAVLSSNIVPFNDSFTFTDVPVQTSLAANITLEINDSFDFSDSVNQTPSTSFNSYIRRYLNDVVQ